jgi:hypothetical protein
LKWKIIILRLTKKLEIILLLYLWLRTLIINSSSSHPKLSSNQSMKKCKNKTSDLDVFANDTFGIRLEA